MEIFSRFFFFFFRELKECVFQRELQVLFQILDVTRNVTHDETRQERCER